MKANELRIGNWVKDSGIVFKVLALMNDMVAYKKEEIIIDKDYWWFELSGVDPIPLTPEILEKAGFKYTGSLYRLGMFDIGLNGDDFVKQIYTVVVKKELGLKVKYLHRLQNIYYAITGEELEINLNP